MCTVISVGMQRAFDSVSHIGLLCKLVELGVHSYLVGKIKYYILIRRFQAQINYYSSDFGLVKSGVFQGSILVPYLSNLFLPVLPHTDPNSTKININASKSTTFYIRNSSENCDKYDVSESESLQPNIVDFVISIRNKNIRE